MYVMIMNIMNRLILMSLSKMHNSSDTSNTRCQIWLSCFGVLQLSPRIDSHIVSRTLLNVCTVEEVRFLACTCVFT